MESLGGKYSGIMVNRLKSGKLSFYIQYRNEVGKATKEKVGTSPDMTKTKALSILNEKKARVKELKKNLKENSPVVFSMKKKKKDNTRYTLNDLAEFYFTNKIVRTTKETKIRFNFHVKDEDFAKIPLVSLISDPEKKEDLIEEFIKRKLQQRTDKRRNVSYYNDLSIEEKEMKEVEKNEREIKKFQNFIESYPDDEENWVYKNKIKYLKKKNDILRLRNNEEEALKVWKDKLIAEGDKRYILGLLSTKTVREILLLCITITNFGIERKRLGISNPFILLKDDRFKLKIDNVKDRYLTKKEMKVFLTEVKRISRKYKKQETIYIIVLLALTLGARQSTIMAIRIGDINLEEMVIHLRNHKSSKFYSGVVASEEIKKEIKKIAGDREETDYLFINRNGTRRYRFPRKIQEILDYTVNYKRDFVNWLSIKDFRNTMASHLVMRGVPIEQVSQILDHADIGITQRYAHLAENSAKNEISKMIGDFTE